VIFHGIPKIESIRRRKPKLMNTDGDEEEDLSEEEEL
jgi:hypothetical protein